MANLTKVKLSSLPREMVYAEDGDTFFMTMNNACTSANMQENKAAFEAWALCARTVGYKCVVLSESDLPNETMKPLEQQHYNRFLYRALRFKEGFDWFALSDELKEKTNRFAKTELSRDDLFVNAPIIEATQKTDSPEAKIERLLVLGKYREFLNEQFKLDIAKYYNQLPVGLFGGSIVSKAAIFPRSHAAIDIWGLNGNTFHLVELKVKKNQNLGVLSEVFFYACFMHDMYCRKHLERKIDPVYEKRYEKIRGYSELVKASIDSVVIHILTEKKHPRLDAAFAELMQCKLDGIRFENSVCYPLSELDVMPRMNAVIYRGTREIGGTLIVLNIKQSRLLLDAGYPLFLNGNPIDDRVSKLPPEELLKLGVLPKINGLYKWDTPNIDGVIISHAHIDHYGLLKYVHPDIPVHLSAGTKTLIEVSQTFKICEQYPINARLFKMYEAFDVGRFSIKPYLIDHSAFDAAAFEIRAEGKTVIYSGDFRGHGRKAVCLDTFIKHVTKQADVLFTEGSMVSRNDELTITEDELELIIVDRIKGQDGITLFQSSSQNIDRIVSFYRAALRLGKTFVVDVYTANVLHELHALGNKIPFPSYDKIKVFYPYRLTQKVFNEIGAEYAKRFSAFHIPKEKLEAQQNEIVMLARPSMKKDLERCNLTGGTFIYSMWQGYRESAYQQEFESWLRERGFHDDFLHTSGHATVSDIRRLIDGANPKKIIPIHTMQPNSFLDYSEKVELKKDGIAFDI